MFNKDKPKKGSAKFKVICFLVFESGHKSSFYNVLDTKKEAENYYKEICDKIRKAMQTDDITMLDNNSAVRGKQITYFICNTPEEMVLY